MTHTILVVATTAVVVYTILHTIKHMPRPRRFQPPTPGCNNYTCPICNE
jgi:hypothetical protein